MTHAVCLGFDFDAVSGWIHGYGATDSPTKLSRGEYGARVGVPRILDLLDRLDVPATFFTPGHTIESFPEVAGAVHDRGHDVQHHGWSHTSPRDFDSRAAERADVERGIDAIRALTGSPPTGYRSPSWDFSPHTLDVLREFDFAWDSSLMGHDFQPYHLHETGAVDPEEPYDTGPETAILEFPVSWHRDDWPAFQFVPGSDMPMTGFDETAPFDLWLAQFEWMRDHVDAGVFSLTFHPQVVAQPPRLAYLEELLATLGAYDDVAFEPFDDVARRF
jgi:peptidoglycan/xylan/chitin deacetylase (PgdA/CDA1 family)